MDNKIDPLSVGYLPDNPSEFLTDSVDAPKSVEDMKAEDIQAIIEEAQEIKKEKLSEEIKLLNTPTVFTITEAVLFETAVDLYKLIARKAKSYIKLYSLEKGCTQYWSRHKKFKRHNYKLNAEYNPYLYDVELRSKEMKEKFILITDRETPEEAAIKGAYRIGFLESLDYKACTKAFPEDLIVRVLGENYMDKAKRILILAERKEQILADMNQEIEYSQKLKWKDEIDEEIYKLRGGL